MHRSCAIKFSSFSRVFRLSHIAVGLLGLASLAANAASTSTNQAQQAVQMAQLQALENYLAQNPDNPDALYSYARALIAAQRTAEAREAYLGILRLRPGHLAATMELATLDHQLQQLESARAGYEQLLRSQELSPDVRTVIEQRLAQLNQALKKHHFYGSVTLGLTAQHNANSGSANPWVNILGNTYPLWDSAKPRSDVSRTASASLGWRWRFNSAGDYLQTQANVLRSLPQHIASNRRDQFSLNVGPSFSMARWGLQGTVGLQAVLSGVDVARARYMNSQGLEASANWAVAPQHMLTASWGHHRENYAQNHVHTQGNRQDQHRNEWSLAWQYQLNANASVFARWVHERRAAQVSTYSLQRSTWIAGASVRYASPLSWSPGAWRTSINISYAPKSHKAPDTSQQADVVQRTKSKSLGLSQHIPLTQALSLNAGASWMKVRSNYDMATYNDRSLNVSVTYAL